MIMVRPAQWRSGGTFALTAWKSLRRISSSALAIASGRLSAGLRSARVSDHGSARGSDPAERADRRSLARVLLRPLPSRSSRSSLTRAAIRSICRSASKSISVRKTLRPRSEPVRGEQGGQSPGDLHRFRGVRAEADTQTVGGRRRECLLELQRDLQDRLTGQEHGDGSAVTGVEDGQIALAADCSQVERPVSEMKRRRFELPADGRVKPSAVDQNR